MPTERVQVLLKTVLGIFKIALFERSAYFYVTISGNFERF